MFNCVKDVSCPQFAAVTAVCIASCWAGGEWNRKRNKEAILMQ